jgi:hypothetical protein
MPPKKGPPTPNKPPENPNWTLDEGEEMRRDINDLQKKTVTKDELQEMRDSMEANMHSMEAKLMDSMEAKLLRWIQWKLSWILRWIQWKLRSWK